MSFVHRCCEARTNSGCFPARLAVPKMPRRLSDQIADRIEKATGLVITVHQFRHAAAALWLKHHPGDYETVRRVLGHRNLQTTINFYCGLETTQANIMFGAMIGKLRKSAPDGG